MAEPITVTITNLNSPIRTIKVSNKMGESAVTSVAGRVGDILLTQSDVAGLENVNNTSDLNKPISTATQAAIDAIDVSSYAPINHQHLLADITNAGTAAAANVGDFATFSHQHLLSDITNAGTAAGSNVGDFATSTQGTKADSALQTGSNISSLVNDSGYITDALQSGDNVSSLVNDAGYITSAAYPVDSVNSQVGAVVLDADDISDASTTNKFVDQAKLDDIASAIQSGDIDTLAKINSILTTPDLIDITDSRLTDARTPTSHASTHTDGTDDIQDATNSVKGLATALQIQKLESIESGANVTDAANVSGAGAQMTSEKGQINGYASLNSIGQVPSAQLPSYVDDVLEYDDLASFPVVGEAGIIYVADDTGKIYRWSGTAYIEISNGSPVTSVNSEIGNVVLDPDHLDDSATTNKFTNASDIAKLSGIAPNAEVNVNSDWDATSGDAEILNKPDLGTIAAFDSGDYSLLGHTHIVSEITDLNTGSFVLTGHSHTVSDITDLNTGLFASVSHNHNSEDILDAGSVITYDVSPLFSEADSNEVVLGSDPRLDWASSVGSAAYLDVPTIGDALSFEVVKGSDTRLSDNRDPNNHASNHTDGTDDIQDATTGQKGLATSVQVLKLESIASGAEVNVQSDWDATSGDSFILNQPAFGDITGSNIADFATSGQGLLADSALQNGDNISELVNDVGYLTAGTIDFSLAYTGIAVDYTGLADDYVVDATSADITVTLPTAVGIVGKSYIVKNSSAGVITISPSGAETIDGESSIDTNSKTALTLLSTNSNWIII